MSIITYKILNNFTEIAHFCTTRHGGVSVGNYASFNLSPFTGDELNGVAENYNKLGELLEIQSRPIIIPYQTHGTEIREIDNLFFSLSAIERNLYLNGVDAIFTRLPNICIGITTADCVPLLFFDPIKKVIAAVHAGWRGTCSRIAEKTIRVLIEKYSCHPDDIRAVIGPSISAEFYEVGNEVVAGFDAVGFDVSEIVTVRNNASYLDLWKANQLSLEGIGILKQHIEIAGICTYKEHENFYSARKLGVKSGRILSGIMIKN